MPDEIDKITEQNSLLFAKKIAFLRENAKIPHGAKGLCDWCGEESLRLINNYCARCRDKHKL